MNGDKEVAGMLQRLMGKIEAVGFLMLAEQIRTEDPASATKYVNRAKNLLGA